MKEYKRLKKNGFSKDLAKILARVKRWRLGEGKMEISSIVRWVKQ